MLNMKVEVSLRMLFVLTHTTLNKSHILQHVEECLSLSELFRKTTHISTVCAEDSESYWEIVPKNREKLTREVMTFVKFSGVASKEGSSCSQVQHLPCTGIHYHA